MSKRGHYSVRPRYTCGSPAQVSEEIARKVAHDESLVHEFIVKGGQGKEEQEKALKQGLSGISEHLIEIKHGWLVNDLITGERYERLRGVLPRIGDEVIEDAKGVRLFVEEVSKIHVGLAYQRHGTIAVVPSVADFKIFFTIIRKVQT